MGRTTQSKRDYLSTLGRDRVKWVSTNCQSRGKDLLVSWTGSSGREHDRTGGAALLGGGRPQPSVGKSMPLETIMLSETSQTPTLQNRMIAITCETQSTKNQIHMDRTKLGNGSFARGKEGKSEGNENTIKMYRLIPCDESSHCPLYQGQIKIATRNGDDGAAQSGGGPHTRWSPHCRRRQGRHWRHQKKGCRKPRCCGAWLLGFRGAVAVLERR